MVDLELLSSALTIVIGDVICKPKIEENEGSIKIIYNLLGVTITKLSTMFELEHCVRLDFFVEKVTIKIKHEIYNSLSRKYVDESIRKL